MTLWYKTDFWYEYFVAGPRVFAFVLMGAAFGVEKRLFGFIGLTILLVTVFFQYWLYRGLPTVEVEEV